MWNRRNFVASTAAAAGTSALTAHAQSTEDTGGNQKLIRVGVMGLSRGVSLAQDLAAMDAVEVSYLCDVDERRSSSVARQFEKSKGVTKPPRVVTDFREILADESIDVLVCAAPNHWHGPATIMACKAGKHVYVEKPCSHNPQEGEWMIAAAKKFGRCVQMGTQRRSAAGTREAIAKLHEGVIGQVHLARAYYNSLRGSIGKGTITEPPEGLDYRLWEGPAPHTPYRSNVVHYNWHWFWHWGGGELANNGVHSLDLCRWGLNVDYPVQTISSGGRYWFDDDQETPDVQAAVFEFEGGKQITWDSLSCNKHGVDFICAFYGDQGSLELDSNGHYRIFDRNNQLVTDETSQTSVGQVEHLTNFLEAVRAGDPELLNQPITEGHKSTLLCHLGNIALRTKRTVISDPTSGAILGDADQQAFWRRKYDPAWEADVSM